MIKSLPKQLRRNFVPAPDFAERCGPLMLRDPNRPLAEALASALQQLTGTRVNQDDWQTELWPDHLLMRAELLDEHGKTIDEGRNIEYLQRKYIDQIEETLASNESNAFERTDLTDWNFGDLPEWVEVQTQGVQMKGYPALVDEDGVLCLRLLATEQAALDAMHAGLRLLYKKCLHKEVKYLLRNLPGIDVLTLRFAAFGKSDVLKQDIVNAGVDQAFITDRAAPRTREEFYQILDTQKGELVKIVNDICAVLNVVFESHREVSRRMRGSVSLSWVEAIADIKDQISHLIYPGFVARIPPERLNRLPIYFKAMLKRLDTLDGSPDRDRRRRAELLPVWGSLKSLLEINPQPAVSNIRWLIEELRVSIFAQELGAVDKVSVGKIETLIEKIR